MHGRKQKQREEEAAEPAEVKNARTAKFRKLRIMLRTGLDCRRANDTSQVAFDLCGHLLCINPSINTLWNVRREALRARAEALPGFEPHKLGLPEDTAERRRLLVQNELSLNAQSLTQGNVKSHEAWSHRMWVVRELACEGKYANLKSELALCEQLLASDERNFHCYQYRAGVSALAGRGAADDLAFAQGLIDRNFSNYSAWHLKIKALEALALENGALDSVQLAAEFEAVNNALFTEPDDQSGWMFHRWLIRRVMAAAEAAAGDEEARQACAQLLAEQVTIVRELDEMEGGSKWAILAQVRLALAERAVVGSSVPEDAIKSFAQRLEALDPPHRSFYRHLSRSCRLPA